MAQEGARYHPVTAGIAIEIEVEIAIGTAIEIAIANEMRLR